jgi:cytochrome c peroxidase
MMKKLSFFLISSAVFVSLFFVIGVFISRANEERKIETRKNLFVSYGLRSDGKSPFVSLPPFLAHNSARARLGESLFYDKSFTRTPKRVCSYCHALNEGGTDCKIRNGVMTRPVYNAVFSTVFMHDGSVTNFNDAVRMMVEGKNFCGGMPISNIVEKLSKDPKTVRKFQACYEDGLTEKNFLDAFSQFGRTLITSNTKFDFYFSGSTNTYNASEIKGIEIFKARNCISCHNGPALGGRKIYEGKKVSPLRGLSFRKTYLQQRPTSELSTVLTFMPEGDVENTEERISLIDFLKTM